MMSRLLRRFHKRFPLVYALTIVFLVSSFLETMLIPSTAFAASNTVIYEGSLAGDWANWSWGTNTNFSSAWPDWNGKSSLAFAFDEAWAGLNVHSAGVNTSGYSSVQFYLNGGTDSGQLAKVALYDANNQQIPSAQPVNKYIEGGSVVAKQWRRVTIPLSDLGGANKVITGVAIQDLSGHQQPTMYLNGFQLVAASTSTTASATTPVPTQAPAPTAAPAPSSAISGSQPFTSVPNHPNEYNEAKGALQWMPQIKRAVGDAVAAGLLRPDERQLFENVLLGMVGVESVGKAFLVPNPTSDWHSQGLTQLTFANTYKEEDPFDPMTNLHNALRAVIRYYRKWGNRWDRAVAQHLTGAEDENSQRYTRDWNGTDGQDYAERVVNIVWQAHQLEAKGDLYPNHDNAFQADCGGCWFDRAPTWSLWDSPNLAYNWMPPTNNTAYWYVQAGVDNNIKQPIATNTWMATPSWFYNASPSPDVTAFALRQPTAQEAQAYPAGKTTNSPWGDTYPRRTWSVSNP